MNNNPYLNRVSIFRGGTPIFSLDFVPEKAYITKELMGEHYVGIEFEWNVALDLRKGDYIYFGTDIETQELFYLSETAFPSRNKSTGGFRYELKFHHFTERLKDFLFMYFPFEEDITSGISEGEVTFNLMTSAENFLGLVIENIDKRANIGALTFRVADDIKDEVKLISFSNTDIFSALTQIAEEFETEWWFDGRELVLGECIFGTEVVLQYDLDLEDINVSNSTERIITRLYAFGSNRNMLGGRLTIPPIDLYEPLPQSQVIEGVVTFDDVYPRQASSITELDYYIVGGSKDPAMPPERPFEPTDPPEGEGDLPIVTTSTTNEGEDVETYIYQFRGSDMGIGDTNQIIAGKPLMVAFTSGSLAGEEFELIMVYKIVNEVRELWYEIKYIEQEGLFPYLPNNVVSPKVGDEYFLFNVKTEELLPQLVIDAKEELHTLALEYFEKRKDNYVYDIDTRSILAEELSNDLEIGQRVKIIDSLSEEIISRVQKYTKDIYNKFEASYQIGQKPQYSKLGALEDTVNRSYSKMLEPASATSDGYLLSRDWLKFDNKASKLLAVLGVDGVKGGGTLNDNIILSLDWDRINERVGDKHYTEEVQIASDKWEIQHNLNKHPSVTVINDFGREVIGDIEYVDLNNIVIHFSASFAGTVICN